MAELKLGGTSIVSDASGTPTLNAGVTLNSTFPAGHIINVESDTKTGVQSTNSYWGTAWVDATSLSVSWTPTSATNYVWLSGDVNLSPNQASKVVHGDFIRLEEIRLVLSESEFQLLPHPLLCP